MLCSETNKNEYWYHPAVSVPVPRYSIGEKNANKFWLKSKSGSAKKFGIGIWQKERPTILNK